MAYTPAVLVWGIIQQFLLLVTLTSTFSLMCWDHGAVGHWLHLFGSKSDGQQATILSSIALKELVTVTLALAVWGPLWSGKLVVCHSDNKTVVAQLNSLHARDPLASNMLRCIALLQAQFGFCLRPAHIPGLRNVGADHLSRGRAQAFLELCPSFSHFPTQVPTSSS